MRTPLATTSGFGRSADGRGSVKEAASAHRVLSHRPARRDLRRDRGRLERDVLRDHRLAKLAAAKGTEVRSAQEENASWPVVPNSLFSRNSNGSEKT